VKAITYVVAILFMIAVICVGLALLFIPKFNETPLIKANKDFLLDDKIYRCTLIDDLTIGEN